MLTAYWHFHCPTCGMGDFELGHLAQDQELLCEICREEGRGDVLLQRWPSDELAAPSMPARHEPVT